MKIAYIIDYLYGPTGGTERQLLLLAEQLVSRGHNVELFVLRETEFTQNSYDLPYKLTHLNVTTVLSISTFLKMWNLRRSLESRQIDIIHGFFNDVALLLPLFFMRSDVRSFTSRRDMGFWYTWANLFVLRLYARLQTRVMCNCLAVAERVEASEKMPRSNLVVIYNGIQAPEEFSTVPTPHWLRNVHNSNSSIRIALVANIRPVKRIEDLIDSAKLLCETNESLEFYVIGAISDESYFEQLKVRLRISNLKDNFHFVGELKDPIRYLGLFDIGVSTSSSEGFSNSILEYMNAGLPVIATKIGGSPEIVSSGFNGFLFDVGDSEELARRISELIHDKVLFARLARNAKNTAKNFDLNRLAEAHEEVYLR